MILEAGSKALVVHRRLFETDKARYFVGTVDCCEAGLARITGFSWVQDPFTGKFIKKSTPRTKIIGLGSEGHIVYLLPAATQLNQLHFGQEGGTLWLRDTENSFEMDLSEMVHAK